MSPGRFPAAAGSPGRRGRSAGTRRRRLGQQFRRPSRRVAGQRRWYRRARGRQSADSALRFGAVAGARGVDRGRALETRHSSSFIFRDALRDRDTSGSRAGLRRDVRETSICRQGRIRCFGLGMQRVVISASSPRCEDDRIVDEEQTRVFSRATFN